MAPFVGLDRLARDPACAWERGAQDPGLSQLCRLGAPRPGGAPGLRPLPARWAGSGGARAGLVPAVLAEQRYEGLRGGAVSRDTK